MLFDEIHSSEEFGDEAYFSPPSLRLMILSLFTLRAYEFYWFYRNWRFAGERGFSLWLKTILSPFLAFWLFRNIADERKKLGTALPVPSFFLAVIYLFLFIDGFLSHVPDIVKMASFLSFGPLLIANKAMVAINKKGNPDYQYKGLPFYIWIFLAPALALMMYRIALAYAYFFVYPQVVSEFMK